jgi:hypothetical protein
MNKYEKLIEYIINDQEDQARALFHEIVVEKSRDIYESLMDTEVEETVGGSAVDSLVDEISADEEGISEDDLEGDEEFDLGDDDMGDEESMDFDANGEMDDHEEEHGEVEDRVQDLENALDELKAEFDQLMAQEEGSHAGDEAGADEMGAEEPKFGESVEQVEEAKAGSGKSGSGKSGSGVAGSGKSGSGKSGSGKAVSEGEMMREYVEKIKDFYKGDASEGAEVAKGGSAAVNKDSIVAGKNDMGGSAANRLTSAGSGVNGAVLGSVGGSQTHTLSL